MSEQTAFLAFMSTLYGGVILAIAVLTYRDLVKDRGRDPINQAVDWLLKRCGK